jgi:Tfp pilus assembly protein PilX
MRTDEIRGLALLALLLVLALVATVGLALSDIVAGDRQITKNGEQATRALEVAQAGLALAKRELAHDALWTGGTGIAFGEGETMDVEVTSVDATHRLVLSTGNVAGGRRVLEAQIALGDTGVAGDESVVPGSFRER